MSSAEDDRIILPFHVGKPYIAKRLGYLEDRDNEPSKTFSEECYQFLLGMLAMERPRESFEVLRKGMKDIGNGIFKETITEGHGEMIKKGSMFVVNYSLFFETDKEISNSTILSNKPFIGIMGQTLGILPGVALALTTMKNQEKAHFVIPHGLLYGQWGMFPEVPPRQDGFLVVEVIKECYMPRKKNYSSFRTAMLKVDGILEKAKEAFSAGFYHIAIDRYMQISFLLHKKVQTKADKEKRYNILSQVSLYMGMAMNKIDRPDKAMDSLKEAIEHEEKGLLNFTDPFFRGKLYVHAGRTLCQQEKFEEAFECLLKAKTFIGNKAEDELMKLYEAYRQSMRETSAKHSFNITQCDCFY